ncbi:MAG: tetratricopeptide repeat protein [Gemmataceae bacterium]|nr:tetratricopeptide repeat protein [Gemmataceae bacterium]
MNESAVWASPSLDALVGQVADEFIDRLDCGEQPNVEEYAARHPQAADVLRQVLTALQLLRLPPGSNAADNLPEPASEPLGCLGDFHLLREVGRGGMGVVYEAHQISLGRRVALKVLPFAATLDPRQLQRFQNEARAAGCLHHEHIVPVHAVGSERNVHYYAMQFIDGRTLEALLRQKRRELTPPGERTLITPHKPGDATADEPAHKAQKPASGSSGGAAAQTGGGGSTHLSLTGRAWSHRVATWGIEAAEALEHAHGLGIVHRDIKPANLMIDEQGKLWITDFGLARKATDPGLTMPGDLLGTLRYMSPEQALAKHGLVDHRTDIYALGVTLYELLTLRPAIDGKDRQEILNRIAFDEPRPPRSLNRSIPTDLETIVLKAMRKEPAERYPTAAELADDLRRFLEDKPVRARRPTAAQRLRKWARRHWGVVTTAAVALVTLVTALAGVGGWTLRALDEQERSAAAKLDQEKLLAAEGIRKSLDRATAFVKARRWPEALPLAEDAQGRIDRGEGTPALGAAMNELHKDLGLLDRLEGIATEKWDQSLTQMTILSKMEGIATEKWDQSFMQMTILGKMEVRFPLEQPAAVYGPALKKYGIDVTALTVEEAADRIRGRLIEDYLVEALDDWARQERNTTLRNRLLTIARRVNPHGPLAQWRALLARLGKALEAKDDTAARGVKAEMAQFAARIDVKHAPPPTLAFLGRSLMHSGLPREGMEVLRSAHWQHPNSFEINHDLASGYSNQKPPRWVEALRHYAAAVAARPRTAGMYLGVGTTLANLGRRDEALAAYHKALELQPKFLAAHNNLGILWRLAGEPGKAEAAYRKSLELKADSPITLNNLGRLLLDDKARWQEAREVLDRAVERAPHYPHPRSALGVLLARQGKTKQAEAALRRAIACDDRFGEAHHNLAGLLRDQGKFKEAIAHYRKAIEASPDEEWAHHQLGVAWSDWAKRERAEVGAVTPDVLARFDRAEASFRDALAVNKQFPEGWYSLGNALRETGELDRAAEAFREAARLRPKYTEAHFNLGNVYARLGLYEKAIAAYRDAIAAGPGFADAHMSLGTALAFLKKYAEAETSDRTALERGAKPQAAVNLAILLQRLGRFEEALDLLKRVQKQQPPRDPARQHAESLIPTYTWFVAIDRNLPKVLAGKEKWPHPETYVQAAVVCAARNLPAASARFYREGFALIPGLEDDLEDGDRYNAACVAALAARGSGKDDPPPDATERSAWRQQALAWLRADLAVWTRRLQQEGQPAALDVLRTLHRWQRDPDLAGLRDQEQPPDTQKLWAEVRTLLQRARGFHQRIQPVVPVAAKVLKGTLTRDDPRDTFPLTRKSHHKVHVVPLEGGRTYLIELQGRFDTFLRVEDGQQKPLLCNDDVRRDDLSSRLVFTPPRQGDYRLVVTSYRPGATGPYALSIRDAVAVGRPVIEQGELKDTSKKTADGKYYVLHKHTLTGSAPCTIELASPKFATALVLLDSGEMQILAANDAAAPGNARLSRIDYTPRGDEAVTVVVTSSAPGETGPYTLTIRRYEAVKWTAP